MWRRKFAKTNSSPPRTKTSSYRFTQFEFLQLPQWKVEPGVQVGQAQGGQDEQVSGRNAPAEEDPNRVSWDEAKPSGELVAGNPEWRTNAVQNKSLDGTHLPGS